MDILLKNRYFTRECLCHTWNKVSACANGKLWYYNYGGNTYNDILVFLQACKSGQINLLKKIKIKKIKGMTKVMRIKMIELSLKFSMNNNQLEVLRYLIKQFHINIEDNVYIDTRCELPVLAEKGYFAVVQYLLDKHFKNDWDIYDEILSECCYTGQTDIIKYIMKKGVDMSDIYESGGLLTHCAAYGHLDTFIVFDNYYVKKYGSREKHILNKCILTSAGKGYLDIVQYIIEQIKTYSYGTILHAYDTSMEMGKLHVAEYLEKLIHSEKK